MCLFLPFLEFILNVQTQKLYGGSLKMIGIIVDGVNDATIDYFQFAYKANTSFEPGDGTETLFTFDEFPTQVTGLTPNTLYFFAVRSVCVDGTVNPWQDNNMDGPDAWQTINCPVIYLSLIHI